MARILVVEDSAADFSLLRQYLPNHDLTHVMDGQQAIEWLKKTGNHDLPDLIFLDVNLPVMNGEEFLHYRRKCRRKCCIPVLAFSVAEDPQQIRRLYCSGVNAFIRKPMLLGDFERVMKSIEQFWIGTAILPVQGVDDGPANSGSN